MWSTRVNTKCSSGDVWRSSAASRIGLLVFLLLCLSMTACGQEFVPGRILVKAKSHLSETEFSHRISAIGALHYSTLPRTKVRVLSVARERADSILTSLQRDPDIEFAERDYIARRFQTPNDPYVVSGNEWHLMRIQAFQAWDFTIGNSNVVI